MFCKQCGKQLVDNAQFCQYCGTKTVEQNASIFNNVCPPNYPSKPIQNVSYYTQQLSSKEQTSGIIWIVIGILQVFIGLFLWWPILIVAALNIFGATVSFKRSKKVLQPYPCLIQEYEKQLGGLIFALIYNILFGGLIGVIGNIYDFSTRNFVLANRNIFEINNRVN